MQSDVSATPAKAPPPVERPGLYRFITDRNLTWRQAGEALDVHPETVRCWCLPFGDPDLRTPSRAKIEEVFDWSEGAVPPASFYPPRLSAPADAEGGA